MIVFVPTSIEDSYSGVSSAVIYLLWLKLEGVYGNTLLGASFIFLENFYAVEWETGRGS